MRTIEEMIKKEDREKVYNYYTSLGYDHKVAASLTLFTYGKNRYSDFQWTIYTMLYVPVKSICLWKYRRNMSGRKRGLPMERSVLQDMVSEQ